MSAAVVEYPGHSLREERVHFGLHFQMGYSSSRLRRKGSRSSRQAWSRENRGMTFHRNTGSRGGGMEREREKERGRGRERRRERE